MKYLYTILMALLSVTALPLAQATDFDTVISMRAKGAATYYVPGQILGLGSIDLMVDTGSGYVTINEEALASLSEVGQVRYVKNLTGILANGSKMVVEVYSINALNVGGNCWLRDIEAAVFPGKTRFILGLSALSKAAPFIFSIDPPELVLSNCDMPPTEIAEQAPAPALSDIIPIAHTRAWTPPVQARQLPTYR